MARHSGRSARPTSPGAAGRRGRDPERRDDGRGFAFAEAAARLGRGMRERALLVGGHLDDRVLPPGRGHEGALRLRLVRTRSERAGRLTRCESSSPTTTAIVRSGLRLLLDRQPDIEVVAEAADGAEARRDGDP